MQRFVITIDSWDERFWRPLLDELSFFLFTQCVLVFVIMPALVLII
jgi:hypothetical protein